MNTTILIIGGIIFGIVLVLLLVITLLSGFSHNKKPKKQDKLRSNLRDEKLKSDIILQTIEDGVIVIDNQKNIRLFNNGATIITGWNSQEAVGLDYKLVLKLIDDKGNEYDELKNPFSRVFNQKSIIRDNEATLISKSNKHKAVNISVSPLLDDDNNVSGAVGVFRDVSQERNEERQRAEFISTASHEMRTPVAAIEGYLALAMNDRVCNIDAKARNYLEKAHASTQHLGKLFQDLLTSAKAEDGRLSSHPKIIELGEFLEKLTEDLKFTAEKKQLSMEFILGSADQQTIDATSKNKVIKPLYYVFVDPDRLREVITNLFDNAVKYTDSGKLSIGLTGNNDVAQFYIQDTGAGIPPEDIPHLFQKFYRVDNSTTRTVGGTGLGLFISRKIIELYDGRIWVESEPSKGSTFFVNLPRIDNQKARQYIQQSSNTNPQQTSTNKTSV